VREFKEASKRPASPAPACGKIAAISDSAARGRPPITRSARPQGAFFVSHARRGPCACVAVSQLRQPVVDLPIYGSIPAGFTEDRGKRPTAASPSTSRRWSQADPAHLRPGSAWRFHDRQVHHGRRPPWCWNTGMTPRPGDVVAALIDNESTLKTLRREKGQTLSPGGESEISQAHSGAGTGNPGVMVARSQTKMSFVCSRVIVHNRCGRLLRVVEQAADRGCAASRRGRGRETRDRRFGVV